MIGSYSCDPYNSNFQYDLFRFLNCLVSSRSDLNADKTKGKLKLFNLELLTPPPPHTHTPPPELPQSTQTGRTQASPGHRLKHAILPVSTTGR